MNKNIFRSRTVIGAVCILLAVLVCFGITPLFNEGLKAQTEAVRVKAEVIPQGTYITADMVEVYTRGASGMEDSVATSLDEVVGRYTDGGAAEKHGCEYGVAVLGAADTV